MIWIGTSGYNYPEWKGSFYPSDLPAAKMLPYYAARFPTVEINYTFYRMPNEKLVDGWASQTPDPYKLTLKAPRRITHDSGREISRCASPTARSYRRPSESRRITPIFDCAMKATLLTTSAAGPKSSPATPRRAAMSLFISNMKRRGRGLSSGVFSESDWG